MTSKLPQQTALAPSFSPRARVPALDALRGLAVVLMVQQHLGVWLAFGLGAQSWLWPLFMALNMMGGAAAPLFVLLSGVGVALAERCARLDPALWGLRGCTLFGFGVLLNLLTPHWFSAQSFYILHLLGVWLLLAPWVARAHRASLWVMTAIVVCGAAVLQAALSTAPALGNEALSDASKPGGLFRLAFVEGHFPVFPWFAHAVVGLWAGREVMADRARRLLTAAGVLGLITAALVGLPTLDRTLAVQSPFRQFVRFSFYPASVAFTCGLMAVCLGLVFLLVKWDAAAFESFARREKNQEAPRGRARFQSCSAWVCLGRTSLTLLFVHIVVFRELFERWELRNSFSAGATLAIIVAFVVGWAWLSRLWLESELFLSLEWWLRVIPEKVLKNVRGTRSDRE